MRMETGGWTLFELSGNQTDGEIYNSHSSEEWGNQSRRSEGRPVGYFVGYSDTLDTL